MKLLQIMTREIRYQLRSIVFWLLVIVLVMFYYTQFGIASETQLEPEPSSSRPYGYTYDLTPEQEMAAIARRLNFDIRNGSTTRQGLIINKDLRLTSEQKEFMNQLYQELKNNQLSYQVFEAKLQELDEWLGGRTIYGKEFRSKFLSRPLTFEEAQAQFETLVHQEGLANSYARLFADYMGITAGLFPVFVGAFVLARDRRTRMEELIRVRGISPLTYIIAKYLSIVLLLGLVYLIIALYPTYVFRQVCQQGAYPFQPLAFIKYTAGWVVPTLMFTVALSMTVAELTGSGLVAIVIQTVLWFTSITQLKGDYSFSKYIIRFNSAVDYELYHMCANDILINRLFYLAVSGILVLICAWIWSRKSVAERGKKGVGKFFIGFNKIQQQNTM